MYLLAIEQLHGIGEISKVILVVDDNANNQLVTRVALEHFGYKAHIVDNGEEALKAYTSNFYDLILMDCRMPILDGYEATEAIREAERCRKLPRTPIVALTACALEGDREKCLAVGMDDYFTKPISLDGLKVILDRWLAPIRN